MTLLKLKPSTIDIDFTGPKQDIEDFRRAESDLHHGYRIDTWTDGDIFSTSLPGDYLSKSILIDSDLTRIELRALSPLDIVVTKASRLNARDWQDIETCITKVKLTAEEILSRSQEVGYAGNDEVYQDSIKSIINRFDKHENNQSP